MEKIKLFILGNREPAYSDKLPSQLILTCRALVGGYLIYLAKGLADGLNKSENEKMLPALIIAGVVFVIFGFYFFYVSVRNLVIGRYVGGKLDLGDNPETTLDGRDADDFDDVITEDEALEEVVSEQSDDENLSE